MIRSKLFTQLPCHKLDPLDDPDIRNSERNHMRDKLLRDIITIWEGNFRAFVASRSKLQ